MYQSQLPEVAAQHLADRRREANADRRARRARRSGRPAPQL